MRFHDLRHACASLLLAQGEHPRVVMETPGHADFGTTMNSYSHVTAVLQREAANKMDAVLRMIRLDTPGILDRRKPVTCY